MDISVPRQLHLFDDRFVVHKTHKCSLHTSILYSTDFKKFRSTLSDTEQIIEERNARKAIVSAVDKGFSQKRGRKAEYIQELSDVFKKPAALQKHLCWKNTAKDVIYRTLEKTYGTSIVIIAFDQASRNYYIHCRENLVGDNADSIKRMTILLFTNYEYKCVLMKHPKTGAAAANLRGVFTTRDPVFQTLKSMIKLGQCGPKHGLNKELVTASVPEPETPTPAKGKGKKEELDIVSLIEKTERRTVNHEASPDSWTLLDRAGFTNWFYDTFSYDGPAPARIIEDVRVDKEEGAFEAKVYQRFVKDYIQEKSPYRGLFLYHSLGTGKTCSAIGVAEALLNFRDVVVMLPASLSENFIDEAMSCGNEYYRKRYHWSYFPIESNPEIRNIRRGLINDNIIKKNKGVWVPSIVARRELGSKPFGSLSASEKDQVVSQVNNIVRNRYKVLHYNGIQKQHIDKMTNNGKANPFDNKVVVIDEVHTFISPVVNDSKIRRKIYSLLMTAKNVKIVCLSGTPIVNSPHEIAFIINLVRGPQYVYSFDSGVKDKKAISEVLTNDLLVNSFDMDPAGRVHVTVVPTRFARKDERSYKVVHTGVDHDAHAVVKNIVSKMKITNAAGKSIKTVKVTENTALPMDKEEFMDDFISSTDGTITNEDIFIRRIIGTVSYVDSPDKSLYPEITAINEVKLEITNEQFPRYSEVRDIERKNEDKSKTSGKKKVKVVDANGDVKDQDGQAKVFKAFSRAVGNFSFPPDIERPYPSTMGLMNSVLAQEIDMSNGDGDGDGDGGGNGSGNGRKGEGEDVPEDAYTAARKKKMIAYKKKLDKAIEDLEANKDEYLVRDLHKYSPKFKSILTNMMSVNGSCLVYSQFRKVEGLGLLGLALEANGWARFPTEIVADKLTIDSAKIKENISNGVPMYAEFTSNKDANRIILNIFNSKWERLPDHIKDKIDECCGKSKNMNIRGGVIKTLMITQSGAEGISLMNVRQVHIMEPYWNYIRMDQVIGRAVRMRSHMALPPGDRNVEVFIYMTSYTKNQIQKNISIQSIDRGETSDEIIMGIAHRKKITNESVADAIKQSAVDCRLYDSTPVDVKEMCYSVPRDMRDDVIIYRHDIKLESRTVKKKVSPDDSGSADGTRLETVKVTRVTIKNVPYIWNKETFELYDEPLFARSGLTKVVGTFKKIDGQRYIINLLSID